ncbi:MAG TPA: glycine cleavage system aminomethyltransferase GcvT [Tepidiformaceae bacterium]|nr:glycine cleavage system aminomethyltransferase GcvT [Tepidiformaceae bacterium]
MDDTATANPAGALRELALRDRHAALGARFAPFAGWEMPLQYEGIVAEHTAVRTRAGVFDVSHLGRCWVTGPSAGEQLRSITTYNVLRLAPGAAHYSLYCNDSGGIDDDIFIYRLDPERWLIVHNAANAEADFARVLAAAGDAAREVTEETVMLAVQGPEALAILGRVLSPEMLSLAEHDCRELSWRGGTVLAARTGYTGEDGAECIAEPSLAGALWDELITAGVQPVGLGARDTLRLEAALPLHGHDIDATTDPYEAGLGWVVSLKDGADFTGRDALLRLKDRPLDRKLAHLVAKERAVLRAGYPVLDPESGSTLASLTSGAFGPTVAKGIGMAYLPPERAEPGTPLAVEIRGKHVPVEVVRRPFYKRSS